MLTTTTNIPYLFSSLYLASDSWQASGCDVSVWLFIHGYIFMITCNDDI